MPRFRLPFTPEQAYKMIMGFYMAEVEYRQRTFVEDKQTESTAWELANILTSANSKFGLLLCGDCGNGKTTYLYALQNLINWLKNMKVFERMYDVYNYDENVGLKIVSARELAYLARQDYQKFLDWCRDTKILAIDDIGEEAREVLDYGNVQNPIMELIEFRYANQYPTYMTSNLDPEEISVKYGVRVADRLMEMVEIIVFDKNIEDSYRKNND